MHKTALKPVFELGDVARKHDNKQTVISVERIHATIRVSTPVIALNQWKLILRKNMMKYPIMIRLYGRVHGRTEYLHPRI